MANFIPSGSGSGSGGQRVSLVERQARINLACSSFLAIGFRPELFTINNLHNYGYTESRFLELIEPFSFITDLGALTCLFNTARQALHYPSITPPNKFYDFVNCIKWMERDLSARMKEKEMSKTGVALARVIVDAAAPHMQQRKRIQRAIDELKKRQTKLETESAKIRTVLDIKLGPLYGYEDPSIDELIIGCYHLYEEDCRSRGITIIPKLDEIIVNERENLVNMFGGIVKERHLVKFLNDPARKEIIENYLKEYIARW